MDFGDFRFWILDFGDLRFWILGILDFGFWISGSLDFGFWGRNPKSKIQNHQSKLFWPNFLDFGFWILDRYVAILYVRPQRPIFWILAGILNFGFWKLGIQDFGFWGFWILDFGRRGFWMLDFGDFGFWGFWIFGILGILGILDFGFWGSWILDFGLGILDWQVVTKIWMLHKKRRLCTPNRVGGFVDLLTQRCTWYDWMFIREIWSFFKAAHLSPMHFWKQSHMVPMDLNTGFQGWALISGPNLQPCLLVTH